VRCPEIDKIRKGGTLKSKRYDLRTGLKKTLREGMLWEGGRRMALGKQDRAFHVYR